MIELAPGVLGEVAALISVLCLGSLPLAKAYVMVTDQRDLRAARKRLCLAFDRHRHDPVLMHLDPPKDPPEQRVSLASETSPYMRAAVRTRTPRISPENVR